MIANLNKYKNEASVAISISINSNYKVIAMPLWDNTENIYHTKLYLVRDDIDNLIPIMQHEKIDMKSDRKSIKMDVVRYIRKLNFNGQFKDYIKRYEYEQKCFDRGNELFECERLGKTGGML